MSAGLYPGGPVPRVSIVIPLYNRVELTRPCVDALARNTRDVEFEVILVDNASSDGTGEFVASLAPPFRSVTNASNLGFAAACNQGAEAARGEFVLFLNNDTEPCPGWLPPLLETIEGDPRVGIVGSKLLYPGTDLIQHAGIALDENKEACHAFHGLPGDLAEADVPRDDEVAVTGACLLVRKSVFEELGRFDLAFRNGCEDLDFCYRARERGYRIAYCPRSVVYHHESASPGRFAASDANRTLLRERWAAKLRGGPLPTLPALFRVANPVLKVKEYMFVAFVGRRLILANTYPPRVIEYPGLLAYALARLRWGLRYAKYRREVARLRRRLAAATR